MTKIIAVKVKSGFVLEVTLSDKSVYAFDMAQVVNDPAPMTSPLRDPQFFSKVFLENGHLAWPNGFDVHAETVVRHGVRDGQVAS